MYSWSQVAARMVVGAMFVSVAAAGGRADNREPAGTASADSSKALPQLAHWTFDEVAGDRIGEESGAAAFEVRAPSASTMRR